MSVLTYLGFRLVPTLTIFLLTADGLSVTSLAPSTDSNEPALCLESGWSSSSS